MPLRCANLTVPVLGGIEGPILISQEDMKEQLSYAYVHAVSSKAGFFCAWRPYPDRESIDVLFSGNGILEEESLFSPRMEAQLKCTSVHEVSNGQINFALPKKNYDDLRLPSAVPQLLIVLLLPEHEDQWLIHTEENLISRKCAYWYCLKGLPESDNIEKVKVHIPARNLFSPEALKDLMTKASKEEEIRYDTA